MCSYEHCSCLQKKCHVDNEFDHCIECVHLDRKCNLTFLMMKWKKVKTEHNCILHERLSAQSVTIVSLTTQNINKDQYSNKLITKTEDLKITKTIDCIDYYMSWAWSFYLREWSLLYKHKRIMLSCFCFKWLFWSFSSKMSEMSIMLIMLIVITSNSSDQSTSRFWLLNDYLIIAVI